MDSPYLERIRQLLPDLQITQVDVNNEGLVNDVVILNREIIVRFPKADWANAALKQETAILDLVRQHVEMPVPYFEPRGEDFVMYHMIPGEPLHRHDILRMNEDGQNHIAQQLATFLRQLHAISVGEIQQHGIGASEAQRNSEAWLKLYDDVQRELFPLMMKSTQAWVHQQFEPVLRDRAWIEDYPPALIHADLAQYHILQAAGAINGVIDFGVGGVGDPAFDYSNLINVYGESFLRRVAAFDPQIDAALDRARFLAGTMELQWLLGGVRSKDFSWFTVHIDRARDMLPVGT
jgi:aminoglycoside 2''-phosphotransferase